MASFKVSTSEGKPLLSYIETDNQEENSIASEIVSRLNNAPPGTYKAVLQAVQDKYGESAIKKYIDDSSLNVLTDFYKQKNITQKWDTAQSAKPPIGEFDTAYYAKQVPNVVENWNKAQTAVNFGGKQLPDIDITERYDPESFLQYHYTTTGKHSGLRANPVQETTAAKTYKETWVPTDREQQLLRDALARPVEGGQSLLEQNVQSYVNEEGETKFRSLVSDTLKETLKELSKAKAKENQFDMLKSMPEFSDVYNMGSTLADSIMGDTGIGGYLSLTGKGKTQEKLKEGIQKAAGLGNNVDYNWQKWFDNVLVKKYENMGANVSAGEASNQLKIDKEFATNYINQYLRPRFNTSKSMSEFISYIDVQANEENVLQTQTVSNKLKELADLKANTFIKNLSSTGSVRSFDPEFYFNPQGNESKQFQYANQAEKVSKDWETAKNNPDAIAAVSDDGTNMTWKQLAYKYGLDLNNKEQFSKLHYDAIGKNSGYDGASDTVTGQDLVDFIQGDLAQALSSAEKTYGSNVFLEFVTPEQLADNMLKNLDRATTPEAWKETLKKYNITDTGQPVEEIKKLLVQGVRTVPAETIRESIEKINKQKKKPTQKLLGIEYIERKEDYAPTNAKGETALYNIFKKSGYGGTEDEFYSDLFPDLDKDEQATLTGAAKGKISAKKFNTSDPFAAIESISSFLPDEEPVKKTTQKQDEEDETTDSYFRMFGDEGSSRKSKSGQTILNEFTSMFSGFK